MSKCIKVLLVGWLLVLPRSLHADPGTDVNTLPAARGLNMNLTPSQVQGITSFLYSKGMAAANNSNPVMIRDFVNSRWMYGVMYQVYESKTMLPSLIPAAWRDKVSLPPLEFNAGIAAPVATQQGTPLVEISINLTDPLKKGMLMGLNKLPESWNNHLQGLAQILKSDAGGAGLLSIGGTGGRDFTSNLWVGGVSLHLKVKFGSASPVAPSAPDSVGNLITPGTDVAAPIPPAASGAPAIPSDSIPANP